ncbi:MAG: DNA polymerase IV [Vicinamibacteria bacterium]|nr:DNA polymerase IV [Vicinamibacteria bacterium]
MNGIGDDGGKGASGGGPVARAILHVDMDAFFAAVEQRDRPELRGQPVVIGADPKGGSGRGVVSTASYEARRFGVGSAMPISKAYRLCPSGVFLPVDMEKYARVSDEIMGVLRRYTDLVEPVSIDEAFLDVTGRRRALGPGQAIAASIKKALRDETSLTASIGVASSKLVAKIASDLEKPDGLVVVAPGSEAEFLSPLPVRRLWGVGPKTEESLLKIGIRTIGDLARQDRARLERRLGSHGQDLRSLAQGIDDRPVQPESSAPKSLGQEHTFERDTDDIETLRVKLIELCDEVGRRLREHSLAGRTITLKYRNETFQTRTRAETIADPADTGEAIFTVAWRLFRAVHGRGRVRLLGVSASGFGSHGQLQLFPADSSSIEHARDAVRRRFGDGALTRASLLVQRRGDRRAE